MTAVKALIDAARQTPGYAGLAVFARGDVLFEEHLDLAYASGLLALRARLACRALPGGPCLTAATSAFTFHVIDMGEMVAVLQLAGRFTGAPRLSCPEPEFAESPSARAGLPTREEVRREAEALLKQYNLQRRG